MPNDGVLPLPAAAQSLPRDYVVVGLPYTPALETLDTASAQTELATRKKVVAAVSFEVVASAGLWAGETLAEADNFAEWPQREVQHGYALGPLHTGRVVRCRSSPRGIPAGGPRWSSASPAPHRDGPCEGGGAGG